MPDLNISKPMTGVLEAVKAGVNAALKAADAAPADAAKPAEAPTEAPAEAVFAPSVYRPGDTGEATLDPIGNSTTGTGGSTSGTRGGTRRASLQLPPSPPPSETISC